MTLLEIEATVVDADVVFEVDDDDDDDDVVTFS